MPSGIRLTILADNVARGVGLIAEHGFAVWVESGDRAVLFDTGQGLVILPNALRLGVALERAEAVLLSHGHFDHTGGLAAVLAPARARRPNYGARFRTSCSPAARAANSASKRPE